MHCSGVFQGLVTQQDEARQDFPIGVPKYHLAVVEAPATDLFEQSQEFLLGLHARFTGPARRRYCTKLQRGAVQRVPASKGVAASKTVEAVFATINLHIGTGLEDDINRITTNLFDIPAKALKGNRPAR